MFGTSDRHRGYIRRMPTTVVVEATDTAMPDGTGVD
jgi:hypothetical protein